MSSGSADGGGAAVRRTGTAEVWTPAQRPITRAFTILNRSVTHP